MEPMPGTVTDIVSAAAGGAVFDHGVFAAHEQVVFVHDPGSGLRAIIAVHSTALGPALGGARFFPYRTEADALADVLRLSQGMTAKAALAGLELGGGKAVIIGDARATRSDALITAFGRMVERLGGRYITAEDVGTTVADMDLIRRSTRHVVGTSPAGGGLGDPSPSTALGVFVAMEAVAAHSFGNPSLAGRHVAVAGVGKVGAALAGLLAAAGARLTVADLDDARARQVARDSGAEQAGPDEIHTLACDIYAPCAMGGALSRRTIPRLSCRAVVGAANNQLAEPAAAELLDRAGIVYAPDYVVNAGGLIHVAAEHFRLAATDLSSRVRAIGPTVTAILAAARTAGTTTAAAADRLAQARVANGNAVSSQKGDV
jgi:leucine dehydrogenase